MRTTNRGLYPARTRSSAPVADDRTRDFNLAERKLVVATTFLHGWSSGVRLARELRHRISTGQA